MSFRGCRVVEGRATLFRHHREVSRVQIPGRMGLTERMGLQKGEEEVGVGDRGKYP
jgi:hypothetical protein